MGAVVENVNQKSNFVGQLGKARRMKQVVIFASGSGSNAENIIRYFSKNDGSAVRFVVFSNKIDAPVLARAEALQVAGLFFNKKAFQDGTLDSLLKGINPDLVVLAGFLWKMPDTVIKAFGSRMINIHPSLLPKYGGKGMYGMRVHREVYQNREKKTGITIHYVNEHYDEGQIIRQKEIELSAEDTPEDIARKVHLLEYEYFPKAIEQILNEGH